MADEIYQYAGTVKVPDKALDPIANITINRFNEAVSWQQTERVDNCSLRQTLRNCYDQFHGILSCEDQQIADELGVNAYVNLTALKACVVQAYLLELLTGTNELPWVISPTPVPDLSDIGRYEVLSAIQREIMNNQYRGDLQQLVADAKTSVLRREYEFAQTAAANMQKLMADQCLEGNWNSAMYGVTTDYVVYPFAVLHGPVPVRKPRMEWVGDKVATRMSVGYEFTCISPWDFWYSPDSPDTQRGTGVFIRQRWTRQRLLEAAQMNSYIHDNVVLALEELDGSNNYTQDFRWLSENPEQLDDQLVMWANCSATVDVLVHYGFFSGRELRKYGITELEDEQFYNASVSVLNGHTIQVVVLRNPTLQLRPVHTASFYKTSDRIPSSSIAQRIRDVERCYMTALRYLMYNANGSSGPITEADYSRLSKYMTDEDIATLIPNTVYLADAEVGMSNPALRFNFIPSNMPHYQNLLTYFMDLADRISNIPAALHGTAVGTGVNRTFRGANMLQNNSMKSIQSAVRNMDMTMFGPIGTMLYNYNMTYSKDESIKGDCRVLAQGASGLLQKELDRQNSYEILQMTAAAGQQLMQHPKGLQIMSWALENALGNMGVPKELLGAGSLQAPAQTSMNEAAPQTSGAEAAVMQ